MLDGERLFTIRWAYELWGAGPADSDVLPGSPPHAELQRNRGHDRAALQACGVQTGEEDAQARAHCPRRPEPPHSSRRWRALPFGGLVEAGFPSPADEPLLETLSLEEWLIRNREATYFLNVRGDSMIDAGILPGDVVLVERGSAPHNGDIVIAQIDGE